MILDDGMKKLVKEAVKSPSPDFTDRLMDTLMTEKETSRKSDKNILLMYLLCPLLFVGSWFIKIPDFHYSDFTLHISGWIIPVLASTIIFIGLHFIQEIQRKRMILEELNK